MTTSDDRFTVPLYTVAEAARFLGVPPSTVGTWAHGYRRRSPNRAEVVGEPIIASTGREGRRATIPFIGLAEGMVVSAFRNAGVSLQHLRRAVAVLEKQMGIRHALASSRLYTDGAVILFDYAESAGDEELAELTVVVSQQKVLSEVVREYLTRIEYADDWAASLVSPATDQRVVTVDPVRAFGQPIFIHGGARVEDVLDRFRAGERLSAVAEDFGVPVEDVEDYLRIALPAAA
jgi:uncharacterized protein (DUF433 family)